MTDEQFKYVKQVGDVICFALGGIVVLLIILVIQND